MALLLEGHGDFTVGQLINHKKTFREKFVGIDEDCVKEKGGMARKKHHCKPLVIQYAECLRQ